MTTPNDTKRTARPNFWLRAIEFRKDQMAREYRKSLGDTAREGISDEDYATTMATLEKMARNLGWDESQRDQMRHGRGFGPRRGHHGHHDHGFGHGHRHPGMMRRFGGHDVNHERSAADTTTES